MLGSGRRFVVETVEHLDAALAARAHTQSFCLLDVRLDSRDISPALRRLTERLAQQQGHAHTRPGHQTITRWRQRSRAISHDFEQ